MTYFLLSLIGVIVFVSETENIIHTPDMTPTFSLIEIGEKGEAMSQIRCGAIPIYNKTYLSKS